MSEIEHKYTGRSLLKSFLGAAAGSLLIASATFIHWVFVNSLYGYETWQTILIVMIGIGTSILGWFRPKYFLWMLPFFKGAFLNIGNED